jgi:transposase
MGRFIEGADRRQATLLPDTIEDYVGEENPVRVVDAFVDMLDLRALGFDGVVPEETGRPSYHPATLLRIYVYGYLNQVQSSRGLERECHRNLELIWLTGRLAPDFKTIADFRRDNGPAIRKVCAQFVALCRNLHLLDVASVAIDGSKFKAVNHREKNFTHDRLARRMAAIEGTIDRYLAELDRADRQHEVTGVAVPAAKVKRLKQGIETLKQKLKGLATLEAQMRASGEKQISLTDPDARAMTSQSHSAYVVGYNVQSAVDTQNHIIVAHEVSNVGIDKGHLSSMAGKARDALEAESIEVLADRGYFKSEELAACEEARIETLCTEAADVERAGARPLRPPRLRLRSRVERLRLPGRRSPQLSHDDRGGRQGLASLLDERLRHVRDQGQLHLRQRAPRLQMGARRRPRARAGTAGP